MNRKAIVPVLVIGVAVLAAAALLATGKRLEPAEPEPVPFVVRVTEATPRTVRMTVHAQGTVEPRTQSALVPEVSGTVNWVSPNFASGGYFTAGELLLRIDDRDYRAALARATVGVQRTRAEHEYAQFELQRARELEARELVSRADVESLLRSARVAEAALLDAELALEQTELDLQRTEIRAPFNGIVRSRQVDVGQFVSRGNTVANIYAVDTLEVRLPIADRQLAYLDVPLSRRGEIDPSHAPRVSLSAMFAGATQHWPARLVRTEAEIDPASRMIYAVARIGADGSEPGPLPPVGLFVNAEIQGHVVADIVVLPRAALRNQDRVLIVDQEDRLRFRTVEVLRIYQDEAYISSGLAAGERIVISPLQTVVEGMRVTPIAEARPDAAGEH